MRAGICCLNFPLPKKKKVETETRSWEQVVYVKSDPRKYQKGSGRTELAKQEKLIIPSLMSKSLIGQLRLILLGTF